MANGFFKIFKGTNIQPAASAVTTKGDIGYNSSTDKLELYNGAVDPLVNEAKAATLTNKSIDASANTLTNIANSAISATAAIAYSKLNLSNSILNADINSAAAIAYSKLSLSNSILNADINTAAAIAYSKLNLSNSIVDADIASAAAIVDTKLATISTAGKVSNSATTATNLNTASAIVSRDGSGDFSAGTITASLTGTASGNTTYTANNHGVVLSGSSNAMTVLAPDASITKVLTSGGASADPSWQSISNVIASLPSKNFLLNSAFDWWDKGTSLSLNDGDSTYVPNRWYGSNSLGTDGIITISQVSSSLDGSLYDASIQITQAPSALQANGCEFYQTIENLQSLELYNQNASFQASIKALGNVNQIGVQFFYNTSEAKVTTSIGSEQLVSVSTGSYALASISGQALGTSLTTSGVIGVRIRITGVSSGNTYDLNNGFIVGQAMVSLGTMLPAYQRACLTIASERDSLNRFYWAFKGEIYGQYTSGSFIRGMVSFPTRMRVGPIGTRLGSLGAGNFVYEVAGVGPSGSYSGVNIYVGGVYSAIVEIVSDLTPPTVGAGRIQILGDSSITFDAEI